MSRSFQAFSYRVQARFGSVLDIEVDDTKVSITGPRLSPGLYTFWEGAQAVLLVGCVLAFLLSIILWSWVSLVVAIGLILLHLAVGGIGAGCFWEMQKLIDFGQGKKGSTVTFDKSSIREIKVGAGWARDNLAWIIAPYVGGINQMAKDVAVSFRAPDGVKPGDTVYALHFRDKEQSDAFQELIQAK